LILSDTTIRELDLIAPFSERKKQNGMSYGVGPASYDVRSNQGVTLKPKSFALVSTVEFVKVPADVAGLVVVKSTWMRNGVLVGNGYVDPGFEGQLTVMLVNHSDEVLTVRPLDPIAQLVFWRTDMKAAAPYAGKYQGQGAKPVGAILEVIEPYNRAAEDLYFTRDDDAA
jgi:dCTP deaminase